MGLILFGTLEWSIPAGMASVLTFSLVVASDWHRLLIMDLWFAQIGRYLQIYEGSREAGRVVHLLGEQGPLRAASTHDIHGQ